jgi:hypothetical protein
MALVIPDRWYVTKFHLSTYSTSITLQLNRAVRDVVFANASLICSGDYLLSIEGLNDSVATTSDASGNLYNFPFLKWSGQSDKLTIPERSNTDGKTVTEVTLRILDFSGAVATAPGTRIGVDLELWSHLP